MLLPLGLGLNFPRVPIVTVLLALSLIGYYVYDARNTRATEVETATLLANGQLGSSVEKLFMEFCLAEKGAEPACRNQAGSVGRIFGGAKKTENQKDGKDQEDSKAFSFSEVLAGAKLHQRFQRRVAAEHESLFQLKGYGEFAKAKEAAESMLVEMHQRRNLLSSGNFSMEAMMLAQMKHANLMHLLANLFAFMVFGAYVELRMGALLFLMTYVVGGITGVMAHVLTTASPVHLVGASANISAVMGAFFVLFFNFRMKFLVVGFNTSRTFFGQVSLFFPVLYILGEAVSLFGQSDGLFSGGVAHSAHLGGLAAGIAFGLFWKVVSPLQWPFIYPEEISKTRALAKFGTLAERTHAADWIINHNPENLYARKLVLTEICESSGDLSADSKTFLYRHMSAAASMLMRQGKTATVYEMIGNLPLDVSFRKLFETTGRKNLLLLGDAALDAGNLSLSVRLFDAFAQKFNGTERAFAVRNTLREILAYGAGDPEFQSFLGAYVHKCPENMLPLSVASAIPRSQPHAA